MSKKDNIINSIAIDGPAGAGKSTVAKRLAEMLNIEHIDTGAMYRALTLKVLDMGIDPQNASEVIKILDNTDIDFRDKSIYLDGEIVDKEIRDNKISKSVSYIAVIPEVREKMLLIQQKMAEVRDVVMDGRDICTIVLPNAKFKFFITASTKERAKRRFLELEAKGLENISLDEIEREIIKRDYIDSNREFAPLVRKEDTILIDNTDKTIEESVQMIISELQRG